MCSQKFVVNFSAMCVSVAFVVVCLLIKISASCVAVSVRTGVISSWYWICVLFTDLILSMNFGKVCHFSSLCIFDFPKE